MYVYINFRIYKNVYNANCIYIIEKIDYVLLLSQLFDSIESLKTSKKKNFLLFLIIDTIFTYFQIVTFNIETTNIE